MTAPFQFLSASDDSTTLPAGDAVDIDLPVAGARDWSFALKNTGAYAVTAMTIARYPLGPDSIGEDPVAVSTGIPLAAGSALAIDATREPVTTLRVTLTSTSGTTVRIAGGGW